MSGAAAFSSRAWLAWFAAAASVCARSSNPYVAATVILAALVVASRCSEDLGLVRLFLRLGLVFLAVRVVLFGLTGHVGETTLFTLPALRLPAVVGSFVAGGRVTGEVVGQAAVEGLQLAAVLACVGVFLSVVEMHRLLALLPRGLAEAGLVIAIAVTFAPMLVRTARDVREAQRLRGHRLRSPRSLVAVVIPVLAGALDRSIALAESMDARGFGRREGAARTSRHALRLVAAVALCAGGTMLLFARGPQSVAIALTAASALAIGLSLRGEGSPARRERPTPWNRALVACAAASAVAAAVAGAGSAYAAYTAFAAPQPHVPAVLVAATLTAPALLSSLRATMLRRASRLAEAR